MKLLIVSDIHGSSYYAKKIPEIFKRENADQIIVLGDLYYHGPRNPLTKEYNPAEVADILNGLKEKIKVLKGNCDAEVDEMISQFKMEDHYLEDINGRKVYFTHGHKNNIDNLPDKKIDMMIYGHFHIGFIKEKDGIIFANPGSLSLPKNNGKNSYLILDEEKLILKDLEGNILEEKSVS